MKIKSCRVSKGLLYSIVVFALCCTSIINGINYLSYEKSNKDTNIKIDKENYKNIQLLNIKNDSYGIYDIINEMNRYKDFEITDINCDEKNNKIINIKIKYSGDINKFSSEIASLKNIQNFISADDIIAEHRNGNFEAICILQFKRD